MKFQKSMPISKFNSLQEAEGSGRQKPSIISEVLGALGSNQAGEFTLTFGEYMGVRRAFAHWKSSKSGRKL